MRVFASIGQRRAEMSKCRIAKDGWTIRWSIEWRAVNARSGKGGYRARARMWSGNGSRWKIVGYFRMQAAGSHDPRERRTAASYSSFKPRIFDRGSAKYERSAIHIVWILWAACFIGKLELEMKVIFSEMIAGYFHEGSFFLYNLYILILFFYIMIQVDW